MNLNTAADVKRALASATALEMIRTDFAPGSWNSPDGNPPIGVVRPITVRQSAAWAVEHVRRDGTTTDSYLRIDRASDVTAHGDDTFTKGPNTYRVHA